MKYLVLIFLWLCMFNGTVRVQGDIPTTQGCREILVDSLTLQPIPETVKWLRTKAINTHGQEIDFPDQDIAGMEGQTITVGFEFDPGTMGRILFWIVDMAGNVSCDKWEYTFVVPAEDTPPVTALVNAGYWTGIYNTFVIGKLEDTIDFDWGTGSPAPGVPVDNFSSRFIGNVQVPTSGFYTFYQTQTDGQKTFVDGIWLLTSGWSYHNDVRTQVASIQLTAGLHSIQVDHFAGDGPLAICKLEWSGPGISRQVIPKESWR